MEGHGAVFVRDEEGRTCPHCGDVGLAPAQVRLWHADRSCLKRGKKVSEGGWRPEIDARAVLAEMTLIDAKQREKK
jgi:ribosomal protein L37AE/L43A